MEASLKSDEDSNSLVTMLDKTGRSAITAVVIIVLFSELELVEVLANILRL